MLDPYEVLGVGQFANKDEIKKRYYQLAKKYHPDLSQGASKAERERNAEKFKQVSWAYEYLTKDGYKQDYSGSHSYEGGGMNMNHAEDLFAKVWQEFGLDEYFNEVRSEASTAMYAARHGDYTLLWDFAKERKLLLGSLFVPVVLLARFPGAIQLIFRMSLGVGFVILQSVPPHVAFNLFKKYVLGISKKISDSFRR
eukprot:augustus_masked-scaffold_3-processed-gene-6.61-mRNA-1 protein AED:0.46 eAED:0.47 QI:0/-1/0/1/-1/1/1/0/196